MQSLNPVGLPPDNLRISPMKAIISSGVEKARWGGRRDAVLAHGDPLILAISSETLAAGSTPHGRVWRPG